MWKAKGVALLCLLALGCFIVAGAMSMSEAVSYDQYFASAYEQDFDSLEMDMPFYTARLRRTGCMGRRRPAGIRKKKDAHVRRCCYIVCFMSASRRQACSLPHRFAAKPFKRYS